MNDILERLLNLAQVAETEAERELYTTAAEEIRRLRRELSYHVHTDEDIKVQNDEIERLRENEHLANGVAELAMKHRDVAEAKVERMRVILHDLRPDIQHLEFIEASAEERNTPRLQMLRRALIAISASEKIK